MCFCSFCQAGLLSKLVDKVDMCIEFHDLVTTVDSTWDQVAPLINKLTDLEVTFPLQMQQRLLGLRIVDLLAQAKQQHTEKLVSNLMDCFLPFPAFDQPQMGDGGNACDEASGEHSDLTWSQRVSQRMRASEFDPKKPCLQALGMHIDDKLSLSVSLLVRDIMRTMAGMDEEGASTLRSISAKIVAFLEGELEFMEDPPEAVEDMLGISRAINGLLDYGHSPDFSGVIAMEADVNAGKQTPLAKVGVTLQGSRFYKDLVSDIISNLATYKKTYPKLQAASKAMDKIGTITTKQGCRDLDEILGSMGEIRQGVRQGAALSLELKVQSSILDSASNLKDDESSVPPEGMSEVAKKAAELWPNNPQLKSTSDWLVSHEKNACVVARMRELVEAASTWCHEFDFSKVPILEEKLVACQGFTPKADEAAILESALAAAGVALIADFPSGADSCNVLRKLAVFIGTGLAAQWGLKVQCVPKTLKLRECISSYEALGTNVRERCLADEGRQSVKMLLQHGASLLKGAEVAKIPLEELSRGMCEVLAEYKQTIFHASKDAVEFEEARLSQEIDRCRPTARGRTDGGVWHASAEGTDTLEEIIKVAEATLLKRSPAEFKKDAEAMAASRAKYEEMLGLFETTGNEELRIAHTNMELSLRLSHCEGLLVALFQGVANHDKKTLKSKAHAIKKLFKAIPGASWDSVHPLLQNRVAKAIIMQG